MVKGLDVFQAHFADHSDQFILIGGTAATLVMEQAGLDFRATRDLDIVLHIEAINPAFGAAFWRFIETGGYEIREASDTGKPVLYRFQKPADTSYPFMLELFCRSPDGISLTDSSRLTPIPFGDVVSSLSAILLDDAYYNFILAGRREGGGLTWIGEDRLIPLKAHAWLDLSVRKDRGEQIDSKSIRKHGNDVIRLSQLLSPDRRIPAPPTVAADLDRFLQRLASDGTYSPASLGLDNPLDEIVRRISEAYAMAPD
ncbi:MAG TPA: hypothetical protein VMD03_01105 [Steroidobacteraceae bacterium]|nr:hypothetical protein [Steroidobacteraceae bacterium]